MKTGHGGLFLLLAGLPILAQTAEPLPYFCIEPGTRLHYERYKAGSKQLLQTTDMEILSVENTPDGKQVRYSVVMRKKGKREVLGGKAVLATRIDADGNTYMDFASSVKSFVQGVFPKTKINATGNAGMMPQTITPGDTLPDAHALVELPLFSIRVDVTGRQVLRKEAVTTPVGTFDCTVVRGHKVEDLPLNDRDNWMDDWFTPGIGYVQHILYDGNMKPESVEVLTRMERPAI